MIYGLGFGDQMDETEDMCQSWLGCVVLNDFNHIFIFPFLSFQQTTFCMTFYMTSLNIFPKVHSYGVFIYIVPLTERR